MNIFLLGGRDLEMQTIKSLLISHGDKFFDRGLSWDNACLSAYNSQISKYGENPEYIIYGIELKEDLEDIPANYIKIDHHGSDAHKPSSLEQIADILGIPLNREQMLIAANDSKYIPGMKAEGASDCEIREIREKDRRAQGVTAGDELAARKIIMGHLEDLGYIKVVRNAPAGTFTPICDFLYPYESLLICNSEELCYYGSCCGPVKELLEREIEEWCYSGGGRNGFCGIDLRKMEAEDIEKCNASEKKEIIDRCCKKIIEHRPESFHVFYFPFKWEFHDKNNHEKNTFSDRFSLKWEQQVNGGKKQKQREAENSMWVHRQYAAETVGMEKSTIRKGEEKELFSEKQYFFEFVHQALYDKAGERHPIIRHYERKEPAENNVRYIITVKDGKYGEKEEYSLRVEAINLDLYSTGIGILSFYLQNDVPVQCDEKSVRRINQYGRRIMPPHSGEVTPGKRSLLADKLQITGLDSSDMKRYSDTFEEYSSDRPDLEKTWKPSSIVLNLIKDICPQMEIQSIIDDRMLVSCWYGNDALSSKAAETDITCDDGAAARDFKETWYKQAFIDEDSCTCQNDSMMDKLIGECTYTRWQKSGTLYGVTRYSLFALADASTFSRDTLSMHMRTIYARMFELVIAQSASVLRFSDEVTEVSGLPEENDVEKTTEHIDALYKEYIRFVNKIYFRNVTAQDQGIELYRMMSRQFDTEKQIKDLDAEIDELNQFASLRVDRKRNENGEFLNIIATIFLPMTVISGLLGMNMLTSESLKFKAGFWPEVIIVIVLSVVIIWTCMHFKESIRKFFQKISK